MDLTTRPRMQLYKRPATPAVPAPVPTTITAAAAAAKSKSKVLKINKTALKAKKVKAPSGHPPMREMIIEAISAMNDKGGSSLAAIKKYLQGQYLIDIVKMGYLIRRSLITAVGDNTLVQTKGHGASGSFKLPAKTSTKSSVSKRTTAPAPTATSASLLKRKPTAMTRAKKTTKKAPAKPNKVAAPRAKGKTTKMQKKLNPAAAGDGTAIATTSVSGSGSKQPKKSARKALARK